MKKSILKFYDKLIVAGLMGLFALVGCCTKKNVSDKKETVKVNTDSISKPKKKLPEEIIAMYGVRPDRLEK